MERKNCGTGRCGSCSPSAKAGKAITMQVQRCVVPGCSLPGTKSVCEPVSVSESPDVPAIDAVVWYCDTHFPVACAQ